MLLFRVQSYIIHFVEKLSALRPFGSGSSFQQGFEMALISKDNSSFAVSFSHCPVFGILVDFLFQSTFPFQVVAFP